MSCTYVVYKGISPHSAQIANQKAFGCVYSKVYTSQIQHRLLVQYISWGFVEKGVFDCVESNTLPSQPYTTQIGIVKMLLCWRKHNLYIFVVVYGVQVASIITRCVALLQAAWRIDQIKEKFTTETTQTECVRQQLGTMMFGQTTNNISFVTILVCYVQLSLCRIRLYCGYFLIGIILLTF